MNYNNIRLFISLQIAHLMLCWECELGDTMVLLLLVIMHIKHVDITYDHALRQCCVCGVACVFCWSDVGFRRLQTKARWFKPTMFVRIVTGG